MMHRAYSLLNIKAVREDARIITGTATTPSPDRVGDVVEPLGVKFKNPMPLLLHHRSDMPVGTVRFFKPTSDGIDFEATLPTASVSETLKARIDEAWESVKLGLVRGVSIGFKELEFSRMEGGGLHFLKTEVLEMSLVTIPANADATIDTVKSIDTEQRAASGRSLRSVVVRLNPPASGTSQTRKTPKEGKAMTTLAEQITALETKRASHVAAQTGVMQKSIDAGRSTEPSEQEEFDNLQADVEAIDKDLERFRKLEKTMAVTARPVVGIKDERGGVEVRSSIVVKGPPPMAPGINFARFIKCNWLASKHNRTPAYVAEMQYGADSEIAQTLTKAAVGAGSSLTGNWAYDLVSQEGGVAADFAAYLRPGTILGKFGTGGIPSLRDVPFRTPLIIQTGGGAGYWVGQGKPKPLTSFDFDRTTLDELKVANICVLTEESIRASSPKSDAIVRDQLKEALEARLDIDFIDPAKVAVAGVSPASITNGAPTIVSSGDDADAVRLDVRSLMAKFTSNNNPPSQGVWIMSVDNALALQMMVNTLGQPEFPGVSMSGGSFSGMPVIASNYVSKIVVLVNASDIFLADEGGVSVDMSREASLQMDNAPTTQDALTGTGIALVSMFQTNSVAIRAERIINWKRRRPSAVAYLTSADWGGNVHTA